jgi:WD40 repeat protein
MMLTPAPETPLEELADQAGADPSPSAPYRTFGDYDLLGEIARGGMGVVYQARHRRLNRIVALKMVLSSPLAGEPAARRFRSEAEAAASLDHPNIVPIYEVGETDGRLFYTMKLAEGGSLAAPDAGNGEAGREDADAARHAAWLLAKVARGVHHAHERGLLHRDLKPSNILLDATGEPAVADFGLARWLEEDSDLSRSDLTHSGAIIGSPNYMAPEQAAGRARELTTAADIYSLGAVLFYLLTGRAPFVEATAMATLRAVIEKEPPAPKSLKPGVPRDLDTICRKCLAKDPGSRYTTARALAEDLERWQASEPILARPISAWEQVVKWARRKPAWALLLLLLLLSLPTIIFLLAAGNARVRQAQTLTRLNLYAADMQGAHTALEEADLARARLILANYRPRDGEPELRGFEWRYLSHRARSGQLRVLRNHSEAIDCLAFSPDGQWLASSEVGRTAWFWSTTTWKPERVIDWSGESRKPFRWISFSRNSDFLALSTDPDSPGSETSEQHSLIFDAQSLETHICVRLPDVASGFVPRMLWSPVSDKVAFLAADGPDHRFVGVLDWQAFKANPGRRSAVYTDGVIAEKQLWNPGSFPDAPLLRLPGADALLNFTADGTLLALRGGQVVRYDLEHGGASTPVVSAHVFDYCERSPDGRFLAGFNSRPKDRHSVLLDEFESGVTNYWEMIGHEGDLRCLAISPDSRSILTGSSDHTARVWDSHTRKTVATLRGHSEEVTAVCWSPDGKLLATGSQDRKVMLWSIGPTNRDEGSPEPITGLFGPWMSAPDGPFLAGTARATTPDGQDRLVIWNLAHNERFELPGEPVSPVSAASLLGRERAGVTRLTPVFLSSGGRQLLAVHEVADGQFELRGWDVSARTNALLRTLPLPGARTASLAAPLWAMSPDRRWLARGAEQGNVDVWRVDRPSDGASVLPGTGAPVTQLVFSPDGATLAVGHTEQGKRSTGTLWRLDPAPEQLGKLEFQVAVNGLAFSPDGRTLAAACHDHTVQLWDTTDRSHSVTLAGHKPEVLSVAFSPDGQTLASSDGRTIKLWHLPSGREMFTLYSDLKFGDIVVWVAFTPDGTRLLAADQGGRVQVFLAPPLAELTETGSEP